MIVTALVENQSNSDLKAKRGLSLYPKVCIGGYHLFNPITKKTVSISLLDEIAKELNAFPYMQFYTCHRTGEKAFKYLSGQMPNLHYLSCGKIIEVPCAK